MNDIPKHVGIIMDGNGRWAQERGKKRSFGHQEGSKVLEKIALHAKEIGIKYLSVYAFSVDNFKRSKEEVDFLMDLLIYYFNKKLKKVCKEGIKVIISGRKENLKKEVIEAIDNIVSETKDNKECVLNICLNYGSQEEIVDATKKIVEDIQNKSFTKDDISKELFNKYLYQNLPPLDILIRTGSENRLSNFMLYQMYYAEIFFINKYFPDFNPNDLDEVIKNYQKRDRRFGNIKK